MKRVIREKIFPVGLFITVLTGLFYLWGTAYAHADTPLTATEIAAGDKYGGVICIFLDNPEYRNTQGVVATAVFISKNSDVAIERSMYVVNYAVSSQCPRNWPLLVEVGNNARSLSKGKLI